MTGQLVFFAVMAAIAIVCGLGVILNDNPVRSALCLVLVLFSIAMLFFSLHAVFLGVVQIMVYAGAIMVLFMFVIMLLNLGTPERIIDRLKPQRPLSFVAGLALIVVLAFIIASVPHAAEPTNLTDGLVAPDTIGQALFQPTWLFPFEIVSILLLVAAIGAVMLAKKRI